MLNNKITALLLLSCLWISCNSQKNTKESTGIRVDLDSKESVSVFDLFSRVEVITLETKKGALIDYNPSSNSFYMKEDTLCFYSRKAQDVTLFKLGDGSFIKRMNFLGNGPGEYSSLADFQINSYNRTFDFLTPQGKLLTYDMSEKNKLKETSYIPVRAVHNFLPITPDKYICVNATETKPLFVFNKKEEKIQELDYVLPERILHTAYGISSFPFYVYSDSILFRESFSGNIYSLDTINYALKERFIWDFMEHQFDLSLIPEGNDMLENFKLSRELSMNYASQFSSPIENDKYLLMAFYYKNNGWTLIYNKEKKEAKAISKFKEGVHLDKGVIYKNALYVITQPNVLKLFVNASVLDIKNQSILANITDDNNLVMLKYYFK